MRIATGVFLVAGALSLPAAAQTLPGSADQAKDVIITPGTPVSPIFWGAKNAFQMRNDRLHFDPPAASVQVDPSLMARNREARDRSLMAAREGMMQRYAAAREAQQSAIGAGGTPSKDAESSR